MVRGFVSNRDPVYEVVDIAEQEMNLGENITRNMMVIANKGVRVDDLPIYDLRTLYTKGRKENWGHYTAQDLKAEPFAYRSTDEFYRAAAELIIGPEEGFGDYTTYVGSPEEMVQQVAQTKGGLGYIPANSTLDLKNVKVVPIRRVSLIVNPSVREIVDNIQIQKLSQEQIEQLFRGEYTNWKELGGLDLPIRPILPPIDKDRFAFISDRLVGEDARLSDSTIISTSLEEFYQTLQNTEGGVGLGFYDGAQALELPILDTTRHEVEMNLDFAFIIEPPARSGRWGGISYIIINTLFLILFTLIFSTPVGVLAAIYLVEYAKQSKLVEILRMGTETLAGIPSIVFGLFGNIFFVNILGLGIGFISSTLTVTMMVLPTIIRTSEEALKAVPLSFREGSLALGATKLQTVFKVVLPAAIPGILTGIILAVGRVVGETAVLLYTLGSNYELVRGPSSSARVLSLHLYFLFSEAISFERSFATGAILVFIVLIVNISTTKLISRVNRMAGK
jgi:phosphate transport system permease protein